VLQRGQGATAATTANNTHGAKDSSKHLPSLLFSTLHRLEGKSSFIDIDVFFVESASRF
jgi:hypothetical protein